MSKDVLDAHVRSVHLPSVHNEPTKTLTCPVAHFEYRKQIKKQEMFAKLGNRRPSTANATQKVCNGKLQQKWTFRCLNGKIHYQYVYSSIDIFETSLSL